MTWPLRIKPSYLLLLQAGIVAAQSPEAISRSDREEFRQAYTAARAGVRARPEADSAALRRYLLYPYLEAARITAELDSEQDTSVEVRARDFVVRHEPAPVAQILRRNWLRSLARREEWESFLAVYEPQLADPRLRCQYLAARIATRELEGLAPLIIEQWRTARQLPSDCEPVFQWLRAEGPLTDELIVERVELLLQNGQASFARIIARRLPSDRSAPLLRWANFIETPEAALDAWLASELSEADIAIVLDAWSRLARDRPAAALLRAESMLRAVGEAHASKVALSLAFGLAWDRHPDALAWFARTAARDLDDYALAWLARAALWAGNWAQVSAAIEAMSAQAREQAVWRYWAARAIQAAGDRRQARTLFTALLDADNFYSAMAARHLRQTPAPHPQEFAAEPLVIEEIERLPPFLRVRELAAVGLRTEATLEWQHGYAGLDSGARKQSIHLAARLGLHDIAVATATRHDVFGAYALLYPRPYDVEVSLAAQQSGLAASLIYGLLRQESLFRHDAVSDGGARGLAQLQLETARRAARRLGEHEPSRSDLFDPSVNISLGAAELGHLLERFDSQLPVALAAYNAGPGAANRWWPSEPREADIWIENIPYNETRAYVRRVLWHSLVFEWLGTGRGGNTDAWAETIRRSQAVEPD